eukprot:4204197-Amphidinium_carterae.1
MDICYGAQTDAQQRCLLRATYKFELAPQKQHCTPPILYPSCLRFFSALVFVRGRMFVFSHPTVPKVQHTTSVLGRYVGIKQIMDTKNLTFADFKDQKSALEWAAKKALANQKEYGTEETKPPRGLDSDDWQDLESMA